MAFADHPVLNRSFSRRLQMHGEFRRILLLYNLIPVLNSFEFKLNPVSWFFGLIAIRLLTRRLRKGCPKDAGSGEPVDFYIHNFSEEKSTSVGSGSKNWFPSGGQTNASPFFNPGFRFCPFGHRLHHPGVPS
ncbi:MAG: hypothetical protein ACOCX8_04045 [Bacteroidota bacterium]